MKDLIVGYSDFKPFGSINIATTIRNEALKLVAKWVGTIADTSGDHPQPNFTVASSFVDDALIANACGFDFHAKGFCSLNFVQRQSR